MGEIFELACKELQTLSRAEQGYFARWMMKRVNEMEEAKKTTGQYPKIRGRKLSKDQKDFIEKLRIKHGIKKT